MACTSSALTAQRPSLSASRRLPAQQQGVRVQQLPVQQLDQQQQRVQRVQRRRAAAAGRLAAEPEGASVATSSTDEDRPPPGCARYTVSLPKPLGLVLEEGKGGRGVYVAEILAGGNAAVLAPEIAVGDELIATNGKTFTTEQTYNEQIVKGGERRMGQQAARG